MPRRLSSAHVKDLALFPAAAAPVAVFADLLFGASVPFSVCSPLFFAVLWRAGKRADREQASSSLTARRGGEQSCSSRMSCAALCTKSYIKTRSVIETEAHTHNHPINTHLVILVVLVSDDDGFFWYSYHPPRCSLFSC